LRILTPARSKDFEVLKDSDEILPSNRKTFGVLGTEDDLGVSPAAEDEEEAAVVVFEPGFGFGVLVPVPVLEDLAAEAGVAADVSAADGACAEEEAEGEVVAGSLKLGWGEV